MKSLQLIFLALLSTVASHGQFKKLHAPDNYIPDGPVDHKDEIVIDFGDGEKMELKYYWYNMFRENESIVRNTFCKHFERMLNNLSEEMGKLNVSQGKYYITYEYTDYKRKKGDDLAGVLTVERRAEPDNTEKFSVRNGKLDGKLEYQNIIELHFMSEHLWNAKLYVNDLKNLTNFKQDYYSFFREETPKYLENQWYKENRRTYYFLDEEGLQYYDSSVLGKRYPFVGIKVYPSAGVSFLKSRYSTDLGILLGASINDHQPGRNIRAGLRYQLKAVGDEDYLYGRAYYNGFLDLVVDRNMGKNYYSKQEWVGVGIGYLIHQEGDAYWKNTARVFFKYRSPKLWGVQPEFNYSFKEKRGYIALGIFVAL